MNDRARLSADVSAMGTTARTGRHVPWARQTSDGRHRRGPAVADVIGRIVIDVAAGQAAQRGRGAHRIARVAGRNRAARAEDAASFMAHRRTIGGRPMRDVGRTALAVLPFLMACGTLAGAWLATTGPITSM